MCAVQISSIEHSTIIETSPPKSDQENVQNIGHAQSLSSHYATAKAKGLRLRETSVSETNLILCHSRLCTDDYDVLIVLD